MYNKGGVSRLTKFADVTPESWNILLWKYIEVYMFQAQKFRKKCVAHDNKYKPFRGKTFEAEKLDILFRNSM